MPISTSAYNNHHRHHIYGVPSMPSLALQFCLLLLSSVLAVATAARPLGSTESHTAQPSLMHKSSSSSSTYHQTLTKHAAKDQIMGITRPPSGGGLIITGKEIENCLPKGHRLSSAPSRYTNDQIFRSSDDAASAAERACGSPTTDRWPPTAGAATDIVHRSGKAP